jgi:hypothetical protein
MLGGAPMRLSGTLVCTKPTENPAPNDEDPDNGAEGRKRREWGAPRKPTEQAVNKGISDDSRDYEKESDRGATPHGTLPR